MADICGVLLAAGLSTRFGSNKLLVEIDGKPMVARSAAALTPCSRVVAVVRGDDVELNKTLRDAGVLLVANPEPERGIGYSIACAVRATSDCAGWCILPADMPYVTAASSARVVRALRDGSLLAAPCFRGRRGHPVGFAALYYPELAALDGDVGARVVLEKHVSELKTIASDDAGVIRDIDTPDDAVKN